MQSIPNRLLAYTTPAPDAAYSIRSLERITGGEAVSEPLHRHDFFYLLFVRRGRGTHVVDFESYVIRDGSCILMYPGQVHQHRLAAKADGYLLAFNPSFHPGPGAELLNVNHFALTTEVTEDLHGLLASANSEFQSRQPSYQRILRAQLDILFTQLSRHATYGGATDADGTIPRLRELLERHYTTWKRSADYSTALHLTDRRLNHLCRDRLGKTVTRLRHDRLLLEAKRLLLATTDTVSEIAFHLGFEDVSYFVRFFRKEMSTTPRHFRENSTN